MSDAVLNVSHSLTLMRQLLLLFDPYFTDEELEAESFTNLPAVTTLVSSRTGIRTKMAQG